MHPRTVTTGVAPLLLPASLCAPLCSGPFGPCCGMMRLLPSVKGLSWFFVMLHVLRVKVQCVLCIGVTEFSWIFKSGHILQSFYRLFSDVSQAPYSTLPSSVYCLFCVLPGNRQCAKHCNAVRLHSYCVLFKQLPRKLFVTHPVCCRRQCMAGSRRWQAARRSRDRAARNAPPGRRTRCRQGEGHCRGGGRRGVVRRGLGSGVRLRGGGCRRCRGFRRS